MFTWRWNVAVALRRAMIPRQDLMKIAAGGGGGALGIM